MNRTRRLSECCGVETENNHCIRCGKPCPEKQIIHRRCWDVDLDQFYVSYGGRADRGRARPKLTGDS